MSNTAAAGRDPRVQQMVENPVKYFQAAREQARKEAMEATRRERELKRRAGR